MDSSKQELTGEGPRKFRLHSAQTYRVLKGLVLDTHLIFLTDGILGAE